MTPDEWREGMENEAASVEDEAWAAEARWTARLALTLSLTGWVVSFTLLAIMLIAALNAIFIGYAPLLRPAAQFAATTLLTPTLLLMIPLGFIPTRRGVMARYVFSVMTCVVLLTIFAGRVLTIDVPPRLPELVIGGNIDLLTSFPDLPVTSILIALGAHAIATGIGILLARLPRAWRHV